MIEACKKFKPSATIFEIGNTGKTDAATIMKKKRQTHDTLIEKMCVENDLLSVLFLCNL